MRVSCGGLSRKLTVKRDAEPGWKEEHDAEPGWKKEHDAESE